MRWRTGGRRGHEDEVTLKLIRRLRCEWIQLWMLRKNRSRTLPTSLLAKKTCSPQPITIPCPISVPRLLTLSGDVPPSAPRVRCLEVRRRAQMVGKEILQRLHPHVTLLPV